MKKFNLFFQWLAAVTLLIAHNIANAGGLALCPFALGIVEDDKKKSIDEQLASSLQALSQRMAEVDALKKSGEEQKKLFEEFTKTLNEIKGSNDTFRKQMLTIGEQRQRRGGEVSVGCARHLGAIGLISAMKSKGAALTDAQREMCEREVKSILNLEVKTALGLGDIPLPTEYSGEIVELVYQFGQARTLGTVFPLGAGTVKLPKLTTDPTFGLIGMSGTVTEKSPQIAFVTFNAEKFGGLIRLPSEIDQDSIVAMGQFIARYAARQIAYVEDWQFFCSTGADSGINGAAPGLLTAVVTDACIITQASGKTSPSQATLQNFRDMRGASGLSGAVLRNAKYYVHPTYEALFATFNTSATVTPYQRATAVSPATLDGFPIVWVNVLPAYTNAATAGVCHALFGDASYQYLAPRGSIRMDTSIEAAFTTDEILIRALERLTVGYMATKAVAGLVTAAS